ncbi:MAG TPA: glycoside hydrolase family 2 TIM barrel-domain containing protein [Chloroflexota bacterium]|nr:glycoside hydrolase family 2 TIM barrel-domain containing protein [Chloroflexota bacterium]
MRFNLQISALLQLTLVSALAVQGGTSLARNVLHVSVHRPPSSPRQLVDLDSGWRFFKGDPAGASQPSFDDSGWTPVTLPHTWNAVDGQSGGNYYRGPGWYRRHLSVPESDAGREIYLQFDGANLTTDVYVHGIFAGEHLGGYAAFRFDITGSVHFGSDNVIAVRVDNASNPNVPPLNADFTFFGGLYRPVHLLIADTLSVSAMDYGSSGVFVTPFNISRATAKVGVRVAITNADSGARSASVTATIVTAKGRAVATGSAPVTVPANSGTMSTQSLAISKPHLWDGLRDPYLYTLWVVVRSGARVTDAVAQPFGIRFFKLTTNRGFFLNGHYLDLHGVSLHQDVLNKGWALSPADIKHDFAIIHDLGADAVRMVHYQHDQLSYDLADRMGLVVWAELAVINRVAASAAFTASARQQLIELIRQNYNHPSIFFWSLSNEVQLGPGPNPAPLMKNLNSLAHIEDPSRLTTMALCCVTNPHPMVGITDAVGFNAYFGWYDGTYGQFGPWLDAMHKAHPTIPIALSEFGAGASIHFHSAHPVKQDHTEEYQTLFHEAYWRVLETRRYVWAKFVWTLFDFASAHRHEGDTRGRNDKGLVTYDHATMKDAFYWYKANWSSEPFVYITERRFTPRVGTAQPVQVFSNLKRVSLSVNGVTIGAMTSTGHSFVWKSVTLKPGSNTIAATGSKGGHQYRDHVMWQIEASGTQTQLARRLGSTRSTHRMSTVGVRLRHA